MELDFLNQIGGVSTEVVLGIVIVGAALMVGLFLLRLALRITARLMRLGCLLIVVIVGGLFAAAWLLGL